MPTTTSSVKTADPPFFQGDISYDQPVTAGRRIASPKEPRGTRTPPIYLLKIEPKREKLGMAELRRGLARQIAREVAEADRWPRALSSAKNGKNRRGSSPRIFTSSRRRTQDAMQVSRCAARGWRAVLILQTGRVVRDRRSPPAARPPRRRSTSPTTARGADAPGSRRSSTSRSAVLPDLDDLPESHPLFERLTGWNDLARRRRFETLFRRILDESGVIRRELFFKDDERALTNYLHLFEILLEEARNTGCGLADLVTTLTAYIRGNPQAARRGQRRPAARKRPRRRPDHDHPQEQGPGSRRRLSFRRVCRLRAPDEWHEYHDEGRRVLYLGDDEAAKKAAETEASEERERLFYVALTRAKARLYLPMVPGEPGEHVERRLQASQRPALCSASELSQARIRRGTSGSSLSRIARGF